jgi:hypothetical protein
MTIAICKDQAQRLALRHCVNAASDEQRQADGDELHQQDSDHPEGQTAPVAPEIGPGRTKSSDHDERDACRTYATRVTA